MKNRRITILPLAAALSALATVPATETSAAAPATDAVTPQADKLADQAPNTFVSTGEDLLGFLVTTAPDGTIVAQHRSHSSHSSHSSHHSHYSSR
jgi:hypothetical protein